jgi:hypothetical protein
MARSVKIGLPGEIYPTIKKMPIRYSSQSRQQGGFARGDYICMTTMIDWTWRRSGGREKGGRRTGDGDGSSSWHRRASMISVTMPMNKIR